LIASAAFCKHSRAASTGRSPEEYTLVVK